jgi:hypothetical protein
MRTGRNAPPGAAIFNSISASGRPSMRNAPLASIVAEKVVRTGERPPTTCAATRAPLAGLPSAVLTVPASTASGASVSSISAGIDLSRDMKFEYWAWPRPFPSAAR